MKPANTTSPLRFTRRNLLRGGLAATAAIPLLETTHAWAQTAPPIRFMTFATEFLDCTEVPGDLPPRLAC